MEQSWENLPLHSELGEVDIAEDMQGQYCHHTRADDDEELLRAIFLQQPVTYSGSSLSSSNEMDGSDSSAKKLHPSSTPSTPRTFILSFDKSTIIPATTTTTQEEEPLKKSRNCGKSSLLLSSNNKKNNLEPKVKVSRSQGKKKSRSDSQCLDHIMAERKRRLDLSQKFIALSATIPGLKKTEKTYVIGEAINYVKLLEERVKELEDPNKNKSNESTTMLKKTDQDCCKSSLSDVKARVLENEVLIEIHCEKEIGIEIKIFEVLENLHLIVTASSVLAFGNSTLGFTIVAQTDKASILVGTINYVEQLKKRVMGLEQQNKKGKEPMIFLNKENPYAIGRTTSSETNHENCVRPKELVPNVKVKVLEKNVLIYINCEKENGIQLKILDMLQNLHLFVTSTSILPFGNSTLGIIITAKMDDAFKMTMMDLVDNVRKLLLDGENRKT